MKTGTELIADERQRQIEVEGWTPEHDDAHDGGDLIDAAVNYADIARFIVSTARDDGESYFRGCPPSRSHVWPWDEEWWKPDYKDPVRNLVKAGALIAAEIDRIQRMGGVLCPSCPHEKHAGHQCTFWKDGTRRDQMIQCPCVGEVKQDAS